MEFQEFPKWKYSQGQSIIVPDAASEKALGPGWYDKPGEVPAAISEPPALQDTGDPHAPSAADLDAVAEEEEVKQATSKPKGKKLDFPKIGN